MKTPADRFEKVSRIIEFINKVFIGIVLVLVSSILTFRSNFISDSIKQSELEIKKMEFEQKLMEDFMFNDTTKAKFMHQDMALAILYNYLKDKSEKKEFLLDVALIVAQDTSRKINSLSNLPIEIIFRLDPQKGREVQYSYSKSQENSKDKIHFIANLDDTSRLPDDEIDEEGFARFELLNKLAGSATVFIQVNDYSLNDKAETIRQTLLNKGYLVPSVQYIEGNYKSNNIRYFNSQDFSTMKDLTGIIKKIPNIETPDIQILNLTRSKKFKAPSGYIEIWLNLIKERK